LKGRHWLPPAIVPKDKLVQVDLQLRLRDHRHPDAPGDAGAVFNRRDHNGRLSTLELTAASEPA
jgi:hypothetical protein